MKFSIIMPVYKVENTLNEAIKSILNQNYNDFEIILVDDGSPDSCPQICDSYAGQYENIHVIHKNNGGLSDARNEGVKVASGDYIIFLDSDDKWIETDALNLLNKIIDRFNADVVLFGVMDYYDDIKKTVITRGNYQEELINNSNDIEYITSILCKSNSFPNSAWVICVNRLFLLDNDIYFKKGVTAEDYEWLYKIFTQANTVRVLNRVIYFHTCQRDESITSKPRISSIYGIHSAISYWLSQDRKDWQVLTDRLCSVYMLSLRIYAQLQGQEKENVKRIITIDSIILSHSSKLFFKLSKLLIRLIGIDNFARYLQKYRP